MPHDPTYGSNCSLSGSHDRDSSIQTQFAKSGRPSRRRSRGITALETNCKFDGRMPVFYLLFVVHELAIDFPLLSKTAGESLFWTR
jgi:hypothetical protein